MSDEEITYATVKFHKSSSGLQNEGRCDESQGPKETGHRECSVPWHLIAIALGIFCSILLVAVTVLVIHIFQCRQEKQEQEKNLNNLYQEYSTLKNDRFLKEQMLRNKSVENDVLKNRLDFINREWNRCYGETKIVLDRSESSVVGKNVEGNWFCCGIKCYYFIMTSKRWNGCKQTCENCHLSLLKIDDADELTFLKSQLNQNRYWIGLKYDVKKWKWQWIDGGQSKLSRNSMKHQQWKLSQEPFIQWLRTWQIWLTSTLNVAPPMWTATFQICRKITSSLSSEDILKQVVTEVAREQKAL